MSSAATFATPGGTEIPAARRLTLLCLAALTVMSGATVAPSLLALAAHFAQHPNSALLSRLVLSLPALTIALCAPFAGVISDRYGRRRPLLLAVGLYALAGTSALLQHSLEGILVSRILLGVAVAGTMTSVTALAGDYFTPAQRQVYMGQQGAFISLGGVICLILGGLLAELHWRGPFAIYAVALLLVPAVLLHLPEPQRSHSDKSLRKAPLYNGFWLGFAALLSAAMLNSLAFFLIPTQLPFLLRDIGINSPSLTGIAIATGNLMGALASLMLFPRVCSTFGKFGNFAFSFAAMAVGMSLISIADSYSAIIIAMAVYGSGMGTLIPHIFSTGLQSATEHMRGRVSGALTASIFIGQFLSPFWSQPWIDSFGITSAFSTIGLGLFLLSGVSITVHCLKTKTSTETILR
ncbi:MFS transporter [Microbulbifer epialgicus]|uniref:MFS-type drug efflux transporter P55 n=1 Tax=Microbulbifer epialgicus TaxID=393907 RepID=A0ABV4NYI4_9GAMM